MPTSPFHKKKRFPVTVSLILAGVAFAGLISAAIESPQSAEAYLHAHLSEAAEKSGINWSPTSFDLPEQDRSKIARIITSVEHSSSKDDLQKMLTDQALTVALDNVCFVEEQNCILPVRVNRDLSVVDMNTDFRVINIEEKSLRIDLGANAENTDVELIRVAGETRILRFYQTQSGWMQNLSETIETEAPSFSDRKGKFVQIFDEKFTGLNYYPASASWADFWKEFPVSEIEVDLKIAQALNVNSLRIFLTHDYFDNVNTREEGLSKLNTFLDLCKNKDIKVLLTLFDLRPNYTLSNWAADTRHIDGILSHISNHQAILGVDVKNQPDLDFENWGRGVVEAWLTVMARHIQIEYPNLAVTTGWSKAENAVRLTDVFDVITYHEYENPKNFEGRLNSIIAVSDGKPVMITELGSTVWHPPFIRRLGESAQARRLANQLEQAAQANGVFVWTLHDFDNVGKEVVGPLPWRQAQQKHFGLLREDDTFRPAADILKSFGDRSANEGAEASLINFQSTQKSTF